MILACLLAFLGGAVYEACSVGWVHYSDRGSPLVAALFSMLQAVAQVAGIGESVHDLRAAPFFVVGYGVGTYVAVAIKKRLR